MSIQDMTDWRNKPIKKEKHGGVRAAWFINFMVVTTSFSFIALTGNIVTYLNRTMHMDVAKSSITVTNFTGATFGFSLLGAFISDSWISRFKTILLFVPLEFLGYGLLALQAHFWSLRPPECETAGKWNDCQKLHGFNAAVLYIGLYTVAIGEGCLRACLPSFGGDQFDSDDPVEAHLHLSFFNWFTSGLSFGVLIGPILLAWIDDNGGWEYSFGFSALSILVGILVFMSGLPFYRNKKPRGSPMTRVMQVFVAAFKKRGLPLLENLDGCQQVEAREDMFGMEVLPHTNGLKFLDKAAIDNGDNRPWSLCTITQVEETKIILRLVPIFLSSAFGYISTPLLLTLTIQQAMTMNTKLGNLIIPPASLFIILLTFRMVMLVVYDCLIVPFARRITRHASGITHLQGIGVAFVSLTIGTTVAALVERKRLDTIEENGLQESGAMVPISMFWLALPFFFIGIADMTYFVGLLDFFTTEVSRGMKPMRAAIFWCALGLASLIGSVLIEVVNRATRHGERRMGWLEGNNLNECQLDKFYLLLSAVGVAAFVNYLYWARRYVYRSTPSVGNG